MLHQIGANNLQKYFVKTMFGMMVVLGALGIGTKANAYQEIPPLPSGQPKEVTIVDFGCFERTCTITTNVGKDHWVTSDGTASCDRGVFAWDNTQKPQIGKTAKEAFDKGIPVRLRYSEYHCYDGSQEGVGQPMDLGAIWLLRQ